MKIKDLEITQKLDAVRRRVGGDFKKITTQSYELRTGYNIDHLDDFLRLDHPSGVLVRNGAPVFAYIRDHSWVSRFRRLWTGSDEPYIRNRIHFSMCSKLQEMKKAGRLKARYRITDRVDNMYKIDVAAGWNKSKEMEVSLWPCRHCLNTFSYDGFSYHLSDEAKRSIQRKFNAKEAYEVLRERFESFHDRTSELKSANSPTGYPDDWPEISRQCKIDAGYTCKRCGVNLTQHSECLDTHHKDGNKQNVRLNNLTCLCKLCHAEEHTYYRKTAEQSRQIIERLRRQQGLS